MGADSASRVSYAAASRLGGIVRFAIGDMISSAVTSSFGTANAYCRSKSRQDIIAVGPAWRKRPPGPSDLRCV